MFIYFLFSIITDSLVKINKVVQQIIDTKEEEISLQSYKELLSIFNCLYSDDDFSLRDSILQ